MMTPRCGIAAPASALHSQGERAGGVQEGCGVPEGVGGLYRTLSWWQWHNNKEDREQMMELIVAYSEWSGADRAAAVPEGGWVSR